MMKTLRYFFVAALAMVSFNAMAEDIIWSEDFSSYKAGDVPSSEIYNYVCVDGASATKIYEEALAQGTSPELLVGKTGSGKTGSFTATIPLGTKSGDMFLAFKCNKNIKVEITGGTLGANTGSGNDYLYPITEASGSLVVKFSNTLTSNARLDNIKLYQGQAKKPAGLSWGTSSRTVTIGADDNVFPTLSNANNLAITYSSSDQTVATIAADGTITLVAAGTTVIKAESAETEEFEAGKAEYTLTVKAAIDPDAKGQINNPYTVAEALEAIIALGEGKTASDPSYTNGTVVAITEISETNKNATFTISDDGTATSTVTVFRAKGLGKEDITSADYLKTGDKVTICGKLQYYKDKNNNLTPEISSGYIYSLNGSTGIEAVKANAKFEGKMYNVAGQVVNKGYKGLVIMNGRKFVNK